MIVIIIEGNRKELIFFFFFSGLLLWVGERHLQKLKLFCLYFKVAMMVLRWQPNFNENYILTEPRRSKQLT